MSNRSLAAIGVLALVLVGVPFLVLQHREFGASQSLREGGAVLRLAGEDWGYPSPFQFYPRGPGYVHMSLIFDTLTWKDECGIVGLLAQGWTVSDDRRQYDFTLRRNVRWHDGVRLTAADVVFSLCYLKKHDFRWTRLDMIEDALALDDWRVRILLREPYAPFLVDIAGALPIIPARVWSAVEDPRKFSGEKAVLGSGPFMLESYSKAHGTYSYAANSNHFLGEPRIQRLLYVAAGDKLLALKKGDIDAGTLWSRALDAVSEFRDDPRFRVIQGPSSWVLRLDFNHSHPVLGRREIRKAFAHALDLTDIAQRLRHGHVEVGSAGFLPPASPWRKGDVLTYSYDLQKAKSLVDGTGLKDLQFGLLTTPEYVREADYISSQVAKIGIRITVKSLPSPTRDAFLRQQQFELAINGHGGIGGDPDVLRKQFCAPPSSAKDQASPKARTYSVLNPAATHGYANAELNRLGAAQVREAGPRKRRVLVGQMQALIAQDLPTIALWYPKVYFVYDPHAFDGWFFTPGGIAGGIPITQNKLVYIKRRAR